MPTLSAGHKVLVTGGANGFIATWIVRRFLEKGSYGDKFEIIVVEDVTKEGAFDEAVEGMDGIVHTASPAYPNAASVEEMIGPSVNGSVLKSAAKHGQGIKRIVVTSSCSAAFEAAKVKVFTKEDWKELAIREIKEQGDRAPGPAKYRASKALAEKAAWEFYEDNKFNIKWDLSVLNPPFVFGPIIHDIKGGEHLNVSVRQWYDTVLVGGQPKVFLATQGAAWIDVRDVVEAHVLAMEKEAAGSERIIVSAVDAANSLSPSPIPSHTLLPNGEPGAGRTATHSERYDTSKAEKVLGLKYRSKEETTRDTFADFERRGW